MSLRIIAGERKGAVLTTLGGNRTRPLLGRVRQSMFDMVRDWIPGGVVLDLFAGSGAVGLEALSRGAEWVTFVDGHSDAIDVIQRNVARLRYQDRARTAKVVLPEGIVGVPLAPSGQGYGLVTIMPPYGENLLPPTLDALLKRGKILAPEGLIVGQLETGEPLPERLPTFTQQVEERVYGQTHLVFWRWKFPG